MQHAHTYLPTHTLTSQHTHAHTVSDRKFSILVCTKGSLRMALTEGLCLGVFLRQELIRERRSLLYLVDTAGYEPLKKERRNGAKF